MEPVQDMVSTWSRAPDLFVFVEGGLLKWSRGGVVFKEGHTRSSLQICKDRSC